MSGDRARGQGAVVERHRARICYGPLALIVLVLCLLVVSRGMAWHEWIVGDAHQTSGLRGPRLPRVSFAEAQAPDGSGAWIEYVFGEWQGQDAVPGGMVVYMVLLSASGVLCWITLARALPARSTLEIAYLVVVVGILVWLGVLPFLWFWIMVRSGLASAMAAPSEVIVVPVDVTLVRIRLQGPLTLLASLLVSGVAFLWERICSKRGTDRATTQQV